MIRILTHGFVNVLNSYPDPHGFDHSGDLHPWVDKYLWVFTKPMDTHKYLWVIKNPWILASTYE